MSIQCEVMTSVHRLLICHYFVHCIICPFISVTTDDFCMFVNHYIKNTNVTIAHNILICLFVSIFVCLVWNLINLYCLFSAAVSMVTVITESGEPCVFPFIYGGTVYYGCTSHSHDSLWCSTDFRYNGKWRLCESECILYSLP